MSATTLKQAISDADLDPSGLAVAIGVPQEEVDAWVKANTVPAEHRDAVDQLLEVDAETDADGDSKSPGAQKGRGGRKRTRRANKLTAEVQRAVEVAVSVSFATGEKANLAEVVAGRKRPPHVENDDHARDVVEGLLSLGKYTSEALRTLAELRDVENPIRLGMALSSVERNPLVELNRIVCAMLSKDEESPLPAGDDAVIVVAERLLEASNTKRDLLDYAVSLG